ncbi:MAG: GldM family protein [Bacteroidota bacterium]
MASAKLSNRQKMINMMYLVLLAILALNVSPEVLDALASLHTQLTRSASEAGGVNLAFVNDMKYRIDEEIRNEGKRHNAGLKDTLDQIHQETHDVIELLNQHIAEMDALAKYDAEKAEYISMDESEKNLRYWMGTEEEANDRRGNGEALKLRDRLNTYYGFLETHFGALSSDSVAWEKPRLADPIDQEDPGKRWEQQTFEGPVMANLAVLAAMKLEIFRHEQELLTRAEERIGGRTLVGDKVIAISAPAAKIVPAGLTFQTRIFPALVSSTVQPQFSTSSGRIELENEGNSALLNIPASGNVIPNGKSEGIQRYTANIKVPKADGSFEELSITEEFIVRKPAVSVRSAAVQSLYYKCGNALNVDVPALGDLYDPVLNASGATVRKSPQNKRKLIIEPSGRESVLDVRSRTNGQVIPIEKIPYKVIRAPKPTIEFMVNGRAHNGSAALRGNGRFAIKLTPNADFRRLMPNDANYGIQRVLVKLKSGMTGARLVRTINTAGRDASAAIRLSMPTDIQQARPGDKVFIVLEGIYRKNYRGEKIEDRRFGEYERTISFEIKR